MQQDVLRIKKYANRRLYDTDQSRYITLAELAEIVHGGRHVEVVDAKTEADLTRQVLLQVILEEQERLDLLPIDLLHHIIRVQGTVQAGALSSFLGQSVQQFLKMGEEWSRQVDGVFGDAGRAARTSAASWMEMAESAMKGFTSTAAPGTEPTDDSPPPDDEPKPSGGLADDVAALKEQMAELMRQLSGQGK